MKSTFVLILVFCAATALAQTAEAPGCGPANVKFDVKTDKNQHPVAQPEGGKALVYFIEDDSEFQSHPKPTTRIGVDGKWVTANKGNSFSYFFLDPGEHHLCSSPQSFELSHEITTAAAHFTAEDGKVYYFAVKNRWLLGSMIMHVELTPLDSDEGQLLASKYALSSSHPK